MSVTMVEAGCICDRCGHEHGTPRDNRAFRWCRRIKGTICDICCKQCEYNDDWHCRYDPEGRQKMRELIFANREDERKICKYQERLRTTHNSRRQTKEILMEIIKSKERDIETREKEYERLHAREGQPREMF